MEKAASLMPVELQVCFKLKGILYLPHYNRAGKYVRPGSEDVYTRAELVMLGAERVTEPLWSRSWISG